MKWFCDTWDRYTHCSHDWCTTFKHFAIHNLLTHLSLNTMVARLHVYRTTTIKQPISKEDQGSSAHQFICYWQISFLTTIRLFYDDVNQWVCHSGTHLSICVTPWTHRSIIWRTSPVLRLICHRKDKLKRYNTLYTTLRSMKWVLLICILYS